MSRPFPILFTLSLSAFSLGLSGCGTIYSPVYSNQKNHFKPPERYAKADGVQQKSADEIMKEKDAAEAARKAAAGESSTPPLDPNAPPAAPAAPDAAIPGMATPPAATPPAAVPPAN
jgi:hypothetical protein